MVWSFRLTDARFGRVDKHGTIFRFAFQVNFESSLILHKGANLGTVEGQDVGRDRVNRLQSKVGVFDTEVAISTLEHDSSSSIEIECPSGLRVEPVHFRSDQFAWHKAFAL